MANNLTALDIQERMLPIMEAARAQGWEINMAIEWREGERFTISGQLAPPHPLEALAPAKRAA